VSAPHDAKVSDIYSRTRRSAIMSRVRSSGNKATELRMIELFRAHRIVGWRRNQRLFGKPDFVFRRAAVVVFVDGCFWHGCLQPKHSTLPKQNTSFWWRKLSLNRARDRLVTRTLRNEGWTVIRVWAHDLRPSRALRTVSRIRRALSPISRPQASA
jgi:DNA mismatch endonuclease, patch repair protein